MSATPIAWLALEGAKDNAGEPLVAGLLFFLIPGTLSQAPIYGNKEQTSILSQPVVADGYGRATVFTNGPVDVLVQDSTGATVGTVGSFNANKADAIMLESAAFTGTLPSGAQGAGGKVALTTALATAKESFGGVDFNHLAEVGAVPRTVRVEFRDRGLSARAFGAKGDGSTLDTTALLASIASLKSHGGGTLLLPRGEYIIDALLSVDFDGLRVIGEGSRVTMIRQRSAGVGGIALNGADSFQMSGVQIYGDTGGVNTHAGIYVNNSDGIAFDDVYVQLFGYGFDLVDVSVARLLAGYVAFTGENGICVRLAETYGVGIQGCNLQSDGAGGMGVKILAGAVRTAIRSSTFSGINTNTGIYVDVGATASAGILVSDCDFASHATAIDVEYAGYIGLDASQGNNFRTCAIIDKSILRVAASGTELPITGPGTWTVSGTTQIDLIQCLPTGTEITLIFTNASPPQVTDNVSPTATAYGIQLVGGTWASPTQNDTLTLVNRGGVWYEKSRSAI